MDWLFEARKRFGLCVLDYMVTSNHVHLLVYDREGGDGGNGGVLGKITDRSYVYQSTRVLT